MDALDAIARRRSISRLDDPAPSEEDLRSIFDAAMAAPDHRNNRPWRFFLLQGEAKERFGDVLLEAYVHQCAQTGRVPGEDSKQKERNKLDRAPLVIVACAVFTDDPKAPRSEQLAAVACAVENLLIAATALGYGTMWRTGEAARDPLVKAALGIRIQDEIAGFIYVGTAREAGSGSPGRPGPFDYVETWE